MAMANDSDDYSAKRAAAGKDIGKKNVPGKTGFKAVEQKAAKEYGSVAAGRRVAGAELAKLRSGQYRGRR